MKYRDITTEHGLVVGKEAYSEDEPRRSVAYPGKNPTPLVPGETFELKGMRSKKYVYGPLGGGNHYGPYIALWRGFSMKLSENDWVVTRHDEDADNFEVLLRTGDEKEARKIFAGFGDEYPEMYSPYGKHGGSREGSGRKPLNGTKMRATSLDLPEEDFDEADRQSKDRGISRSELLREIIHRGLRE